MQVVLTRPMVVGHVMRYPGEVVELPDEAEVKVEAEVEAEVKVEAEVEAKPRGRKKT